MEDSLIDISMGAVAQIIYVLGYAGAGKSTLVKNFSLYLQDMGYRVATVNLDPGARMVQYSPDFDVREIVRLEDVMKNESLGPNGGLIRSVEILSRNIDVLQRRIRSLLCANDWLLIDTTGQLELFAFRDLGDKITSVLKDVPNLGLFIIDATTLNKPSDIVMTQLVAMAIQLKLSLDVITAINKIDLTGDKVKSMLKSLYEDPDGFVDYMLESEVDTYSGMTLELVEIIRKYIPPARIVAMSAKSGEGFRDLFDIIHESFCTCGDLT